MGEHNSSQAAQDQTETILEMRDRLIALAEKFEKTQIADYVQLLNHPRKLIMTNILAGIAKGIGIAIGVTIFTATILYLLRQLEVLNLPIVGDYIADIVEIVQMQLRLRSY